MIFDIATGELFRAQVFSELLFRPLLRTSVASCARRFDRDGVAWMQNQARQLSRQIFNGAVCALKCENADFSSFATENAGRRSTKALADPEKFADMSHWPNDAAQSKSSAPAPCPAGVGDQRIFLDAQRIFHFDCFDGQV